MACQPKIELPLIDKNDITFKGYCEGECKNSDSGLCKTSFSLTLDGKTNKNAKVTGSGTGSGQAFIRVSADGGDIDNGLVVLKCTCGNQATEDRFEFTLEHRTSAEDVVLTILTLGVRAALKAAGV